MNEQIEPTKIMVMAERLSCIGLKDGNTTFDYNSLSEAQRQALTKAVQFARNLMDVGTQTIGKVVSGWRHSEKPAIMGTYYHSLKSTAVWMTGLLTGVWKLLSLYNQAVLSGRQSNILRLKMDIR